MKQGRWKADGKRAWSVGEVDLCGTQVADVLAPAGCSSLYTLYLGGMGVTDVLALAGCSSLHTLMLNSTRVTDVSALVGCSSLHTLCLCHMGGDGCVGAGGLLQPAHTRSRQHRGDGCVCAGGLIQPAHALSGRHRGDGCVGAGPRQAADVVRQPLSRDAVTPADSSLHTLNLDRTGVRCWRAAPACTNSTLVVQG